MLLQYAKKKSMLALAIIATKSSEHRFPFHAGLRLT